MERSHDVTQILEAISGGDDRAADELFTVVYDELNGTSPWRGW